MKNLIVKYLIATSLLMIIQVLFFEISLARGFNVFIYIDNNFDNPRIGYAGLTILFFFGVISIFVNTIGGIYLLIKKKNIFIALFCFLAAILFGSHAIETLREL